MNDQLNSVWKNKETGEEIDYATYADLAKDQQDGYEAQAEQANAEESSEPNLDDDMGSNEDAEGITAYTAMQDGE